MCSFGASPFALPPSRFPVYHHSVPTVTDPDFAADDEEEVARGLYRVYVGATGLSPEERFANHKAGHKANWYAQTYGEALLPDLFAHLNPMTNQRALATEIALAEELRKEGFAVWQNYSRGKPFLPFTNSRYLLFSTQYLGPSTQH